MDATLIEKLIDAIQAHTEAIHLNTKAIKFHADVVGYKADNENPPAADGKGRAVKLQLVQPAPAEDQPLVEITIDQVKSALNSFATKYGKEKAMAFIAKYAVSKKPADIPKERYADLINEASK
jgi:hypothetical protein